MTVNKVILVGNLGADPETRTTQSGTTVSNLRIATTERRKDSATGNWGDHTEWHRVVCFGRTAENVARFLSKGPPGLHRGSPAHPQVDQPRGAGPVEHRGRGRPGALPRWAS